MRCTFGVPTYDAMERDIQEHDTCYIIMSTSTAPRLPTAQLKWFYGLRCMPAAAKAVCLGAGDEDTPRRVLAHHTSRAWDPVSSSRPSQTGHQVHLQSQSWCAASVAYTEPCQLM